MNFWAMWMAISTGAMFVFYYVKVVAFGYVAENITENMRSDVYIRVCFANTWGGTMFARTTQESSLQLWLVNAHSCRV